ncbi:MAG: site-specific DNA-methyltransferase [Ignavibacteria bacterium]|nr:site-specific DNA-methyltransferase [Ignavibacteria bacterium]
MKFIEDFKNKVIQGDCLEVMKDIPSNSIDMILCDLPYGTTQNKWDSVIPLTSLWEHYERIIKENGAIALTSQGIFTARLILSNEKLFKYKVIWIKSKPTNFLNAKIQPLRRHEDICIFYKKQPTYNPQMDKGEPYDKGYRKDQHTGSYGDFKPRHVKSENGERYPTDVLNIIEEDSEIIDHIYIKTAEAEGKVYHPTQKPVELGRYLIRTYTKPGDIVLDNACGSGSFLISAIFENRAFVGIEKNEDVLLHKIHPVDYLEICNDRIRLALDKLKKLKQDKSVEQLNLLTYLNKNVAK